MRGIDKFFLGFLAVIYILGTLALVCGTLYYGF